MAFDWDEWNPYASYLCQCMPGAIGVDQKLLGDALASPLNPRRHLHAGSKSTTGAFITSNHAAKEYACAPFWESVLLGPVFYDSGYSYYCYFL
jgi:hypothetical protein